MSLLSIESFDHFDFANITRKYTFIPGSGDTSTITTVGRRTSNGFRMSSAGGASSVTGALSTIPGAGDNTAFIGLAFRSVQPFINLGNGTSPSGGTFSGTTCLLSMRSAGIDQCWVRVNQVGTLTVFRGSTFLGETSVALVQNVFTYIEIRLTVATSGAAVTIRFNGVTVLSLTGQNTANGGFNGWNEVRFGWINPNASTEWDYDDIYILDGIGAAPWNGFLGDVRADFRLVTAAGATTGWTPSTGSNFQNVDEIPPNDDTDFNTAAASGVTDTFVVQDVPVSGAIIYGVQPIMCVKKSDAGACLVAPVIRHSGADFVGIDKGPSVAYAFIRQPYQTNPGTAAQWVEADFNNAEFGYRRTT